MGKGAGNCLGKQTAQPAPQPQAPAKPPAPAQQPIAAKKSHSPAIMAEGKVKVYVLFYSTYGHVYKLAQKEAEGVNSVDGVEAILFQIPETLPQEVLTKMHAAPKPDVPVADPHDLPNADGFLIGFPTRYGSPAAQFKAFWDATGGHWQSGALVGKPVGVFFSTASQNGGQETTALTSFTQFVHHGMPIITPGYSFGPPMFDLTEAHGGSPYGAGTLAATDGSRQPTESELGYALHQGREFAKVAKKLAAKV